MQPMPPQEFFDTQDRIATRNLSLVSAACGAVGVKCNALAIEAVHPWEAILEQAKLQGADLIVMASHGRRGMSALLLGSETQKVLTHGTIPVLVVR
jgi:nucleotide-binding universal stress UspA family protein